MLIKLIMLIFKLIICEILFFFPKGKREKKVLILVYRYSFIFIMCNNERKIAYNWIYDPVKLTHQSKEKIDPTGTLNGMRRCTLCTLDMLSSLLTFLNALNTAPDPCSWWIQTEDGHRACPGLELDRTKDDANHLWRVRLVEACWVQRNSALPPARTFKHLLMF